MSHTKTPLKRSTVVHLLQLLGQLGHGGELAGEAGETGREDRRSDREVPLTPRAVGIDCGKETTPVGLDHAAESVLDLLGPFRRVGSELQVHGLKVSGAPWPGN